MPKRRYKFIFPAELITEPVVYHLGQDYRITTVIRRGDISDDHGWVILDAEGSDEDLEKALSWVREKGITVESQEDSAS